jgi:hypothetical protein
MLLTTSDLPSTHVSARALAEHKKNIRRIRHCVFAKNREDSEVFGIEQKKQFLTASPTVLNICGYLIW